MLRWDHRALVVIDTLRHAGFETVLVGGCVRDRLLGVEPHDYDAATAARPEEMMELFQGWHLVEKGRRHGTITIFSDGLPVEVTTFRTEGEYTDHRRPMEVSFTTSLAEDLKRRDFTVNAMAWSPEGITDLFGGQQDLKDRLLRCVGEPKRRFEEDALRILRGLRLSAQLGFDLEEKTLSALWECLPLLNAVSRERVMEEFFRLICAPGAVRVLMEHQEAVKYIIPELIPAMGFEQHTPYHCYDVYTHSVRVMGNTPPKPRMRLAALLHDIGKPHTYAPDEQGVGHFPDHAKVGATLADQVLRRLRLDNQTREQITTLIARHGMRLPAEERVVRRWMSRLGTELFFDLMILDQADNNAKRPEMVKDAQHWVELYHIARTVAEEGVCLSLRDLKVDGWDAQIAGLKGPEIGKALNAILEDVLEGRRENNRDELLQVLEEWNHKKICEGP